MGSHRVGCRQDRLRGADAAQLGAAGQRDARQRSGLTTEERETGRLALIAPTGLDKTFPQMLEM